MTYRKKIEMLEKKYSETNIQKEEILQPMTIKRINQNYRKGQKNRVIDTVLNNVNNKESIQTEVKDILNELPSYDLLCKNCKEEQIISIIILYVQKTRDKNYRIERTGLWRKYNITWQKYSLVISKLLCFTRKNRKL